MKNRYLVKCISILMCLSFLFSFAGCNLAEDIKVNFENRISSVNNVSAQELTRLIVMSINDSSKTSDAYASINAYQLDNLSYSYFSEYLDILRRNSRQDNNGRVNSFRMMSSSECTSIVGSLLANRFGTLIGAELLYDEEALFPVYMFFIVDDNGVPKISNDWVRGYIDTYNYSDHYFNFLNDENSDGVRALITPSLNDPAYTEEAISARVRALCDYYRLRVMSNVGAYEIVHIYPGNMSVRIPETLAVDGTSFEEHMVNFSYLNSGNYNIDDEVVIAGDLNIVNLVSGENRVLRVGNVYALSELVQRMGSPISSTYYENNNSRIVLYPGVVLRFDESIDSHNWTGTLTSIRVFGNSSVYTIGYNLYVGMSKTALLVAYPFIDENDYEINVSTSTGDYTVEFEFDDDDTVRMIRVS
ncbi:MAG: hypothetical protein MJ094_07625 [Saccharofermentans sp.]|nr:hypothetical protein [Saccharofermentans sp.]